MLSLVVSGFVGRPRRHAIRDPFADQAPGFLTYLRDKRGLREATLGLDDEHLRAFAAYLTDIGQKDLRALTPTVVSGFLTERSGRLKRSTIGASADSGGYVESEVHSDVLFTDRRRRSCAYQKTLGVCSLSDRSACTGMISIFAVLLIAHTTVCAKGDHVGHAVDAYLSPPGGRGIVRPPGVFSKPGMAGGAAVRALSHSLRASSARPSFCSALHRMASR
jgi:hypothetical protein